MLGTTSLASETARIQQHLHGALELLDRRDDVHVLDPAARITRMLLRQALVEYTDEGRFPLNHDLVKGIVSTPAKRPAFIDDYGTRCAMAHLMELGGAGALVAEVARDANHAYVDELAADPRFIEWLVAAGLTVEEAARIQPGYNATASSCICDQLPPGPTGARVTGVVEATVTELPSGDNPGVAKVETVYGTSPIAAGNAMKVDVHNLAMVVGVRVLVPIPPDKDADSTYRALMTVESDGKVGPQIRHSADNWVCGQAGPITAQEAAELRNQASEQACNSALSAKDTCWASSSARRESSTPGDCVYGTGIVPDLDAGSTSSSSSSSGSTQDASPDPGFSSSSGATSSSSGSAAAPASASDDSGCSTSPSSNAFGGTASSLAVLLAVAGAMMVRQKRR